MNEIFSSVGFKRSFLIKTDAVTGGGLSYTDLTEDFVASPELDERILNLYSRPCRLKAGIFAICLEGEVEAEINGDRYRIRGLDFISLLPGSIIRYRGKRGGVKFCFIAFSSVAMGNINLVQTTMEFLLGMQEHPVVALTGETALWLRDYFTLLARAKTLVQVRLHPEVVKNILQSVLYGVGFLYGNRQWDDHVLSRKEEIYKDFLRAVRLHYRKERSVAFYAEVLAISQQHLGTTVKQVSGQTLSDIIAHLVIMDAQAQLRSTDLPIQQIAYSLNFPDVSFFGKYFKRYVGVSPQKYRVNGEHSVPRSE